MRLRISHSTTYRYEPRANGIIQLLRLTPRNHEGQYVADWQIDISSDARLDLQRDAFGNIVHILTQGPTDEFTVSVDGLVETTDTNGILRGTDERFPAALFLRPTDLTATDDAIDTLATGLRAEFAGDSIRLLHALMVRLKMEMTFDPDPTHPGTTASEAFALRRGVCQDYAHIFIACARKAGIPARFVSGHFHRSDGIVHQEAGHAWAEGHVPGLGWIGFDPANGICTTEAHVRVAVGLDYLGAAPVRGTRYGGGTETLDVAVTVDQARRQTQS
ncbi:MAG: transglutaminase family protein [Xanthobacteraceae bacterium]|nr:transglutaminase family protein [Xanthobacteraceae bacterium]